VLDIPWIRKNTDLFNQKLSDRGLPALGNAIVSQDAFYKSLMQEQELLQQKRNQIAQTIGKSGAQGMRAEEKKKLIAEGEDLKRQWSEKEIRLRLEEKKLHHMVECIPNILWDDVPFGAHEGDNVVRHVVGQVPRFSFKPKHHEVIGKDLELMDSQVASELSGARFSLLKGSLARLERALIHWMLQVHHKTGYQEVGVPYLVKEKAVWNVGQLPKFSQDLFQTTDGRWLISTGEVPLTNMVQNQILDESSLPMRLVALTPCFRSEAGAAGKDTHGLIRLHQFHKVELVHFCTPDQGSWEHEVLLKNATNLLDQLQLPYRVVTLCSGDTGFSAAKTFDIEVWLPAQECYREISSCSLCTDFQARRMQARFRPKGQEKKTPLPFIYTLNGSGLPTSRTLAAIIENYQQEDGSIVIPEVLRPYMSGQSCIEKGML
jgi:seryl-tRNA synthetase